MSKLAVSTASVESYSLTRSVAPPPPPELEGVRDTPADP
jgi:hypothetical protein